MIPEAFEKVVGFRRPDLFEVMCEPDSILSKTFQARTGRPDCVSRCSLWCGHDLSTPEGLSTILEQLRTLKPRHVWISPPSGAFSPLQNINQRTPGQIQDLKAKRAHATKLYEGTLEIVKVCLQLGLHVTVEMSERSEAWRLPVMQRIRLHMGLHTCVMKGCTVGLRGKDNMLMQKGWRLVTSHARLSEKLHKPCRCPTNYQHAKCEGRDTKATGRYTKEFGRLVYEALSKEGEASGIIQECVGHSVLSEGFGLGLQCTCQESHQKTQCGSCLVQEREEEEKGQAFLSQNQREQLEQEALKLRTQSQRPQLENLQSLLESHPLRNTGRSRRNQRSPNDYVLFGSYAYGSKYGITNRTRDMPELSRCINRILRTVMPKDMKWSSFVLNHGSCLPLHRDQNNNAAFPNGSVGFGSYEGGGLWVEGDQSVCGRQGIPSRRVNSLGEEITGQEHDIKLRPVVFNPKSWHGSCDWQGDRWVLTVFVSRGLENFSPSEISELQDLGFPVPQPENPKAYPAEHQALPRTSNPQDEKIKKQLYLLHCATGHSHPRHMIQALKRRGVDDHVIRLAEEFKCPVCQEKRKPQPRNLSTLEPLPPKLATICADIGHWTHPHTEECIQFMLVIDEGSRFRVARALSVGSRQSPNAAACIGYLQEGWVQYFGHPKCLRLDPAGAFRSHAIEEWCDKHGVFLDIVAGEAHWKIGTVENAIKGVKEVMSKLCQYDEELSATEALAEAITTFNHREIIRGYSPAQHILGQAPDETGRFIAATQAAPPGLYCENATDEFERAVRLRTEAEKALCEWNSNQRLLRAKHSRHRPCYDYEPGELVFYWRCQDANKGRRQPGGKHGRFLGPARILAVESRREADGTLRPGGAVWLVKGRSLLKCSPEQLRRASHREEVVEALTERHEQQTPWTFHTVAQQIGGNRFQDISEQPDAAEWNRAQQPEEEVQPVRYRFRTKRGAAQREQVEDTIMEEAAMPPQEPEGRPRSRSRGPRGASGAPETATAWWCEVPGNHWPSEGAAYWADEKSAVEIEIPLPESERAKQKAWRNLGAYFVGSMKRRAVELSERRMTAQELEAFKGAKTTEVKNFIAANAFQLLPDHLRPDKSQAIGMRWILTWKLKEDGSRKAKARAVLLGYQDGSYEHRATTSPVMTRQTRQLLLQMASWKRWKVQKGDVTGAFLQSRQYPDDLYCIPCPEICAALGVEAGTVTKVQRACYGLVDAPLEWYRSVDSFLQEIGLQRLWSDSCCWVLRENGVLKGIVSGHVDDFLFAGREGDASWEAVLHAIKAKFKWGDWEDKRFTQCGVVVEQTSEGFELSQPNYLENLHEISVNATRRKQRNDPTTEKEKSQLRALLGGISWHSQQVAPYLAAAVSLLLTEVSRSTVETIIQSNILLSQAKAKQDYRMKIHAFKPEDDLVLIGWVDAANANRCDGGSTQGIFIGAAPREILSGEVCGVSPISWASQKIDRACRSPGAAEAQAAVNGEDSLFAARHQWSEMLHGPPNLQNPSETVSKITGCLVTDSRNVYDKLETEVLVVKGAEKRTSIELLSVKEAQQRTGLLMRWVHSEAQLANSLTKQGGQREYDLYSKMGHRWRLVEDETMMSAKRRKDCGLQPLEQSSGKSKQGNTHPSGCDQLKHPCEPEELRSISFGEKGA